MYKNLVILNIIYHRQKPIESKTHLSENITLYHQSDIHSTSGNIHINGKRRAARETMKCYVLKQMHLSVNDGIAIALRTSAVWRFRKVNSCLKMGKLGRNM
jgi:hypothetical protein